MAQGYDICDGNLQSRVAAATLWFMATSVKLRQGWAPTRSSQQTLRIPTTEGSHRPRLLRPSMTSSTVTASSLTTESVKDELQEPSVRTKISQPLVG